MSKYIVCRKPTANVGTHNTVQCICVVTTKETVEAAVKIALNVRNEKIYKAELAFRILLRTHVPLNYADAINYCRTLNKYVK